MVLNRKNITYVLISILGQFTRNYTQTVKRTADNKRRYAPGEGSIPPVLLSGVSKGGKAPFGTRLCEAKCSVLYLLAWLTGETGCGAFCAPFAPAGKQTEFLRMGMSEKSGCFQRTTAGIWKPPSLVLRSTLWTKCSEVWPHSRKSSRIAGNRQGWNERVCTRPWPPPHRPAEWVDKAANPSKCLAALFWFWSVSFIKIEMGRKPF